MRTSSCCSSCSSPGLRAGDGVQRHLSLHGQRRIEFSSFVQKQIVFAVAGLVLMAVVASVDYRIYHAGAYFVYGVSLVLLALVFVLGHGGREWGSQRWIDLGFFPLQPSEVAKPALVLALARYFADHQQDVRAFKHFVVSALITLPPLALVYMQPDLGTATSFLAIWLIMSLGAGIRLRYLGITVAAGLASLPVIWSMLKEYMRDRITIFLHPESDPWGQGYNIIQAQISIGSGGMFGQGFLAGTQSQGHFLRIQHSDFIFSVLAEEMGFRGAVVLFVLFFLLLMRLISAAGARPGPVRAHGCRGHRRHPPVQHNGERGRQPPAHARHRHTPPLHQLRRQRPAHQPGLPGPRAERADAPQEVPSPLIASARRSSPVH